MSQITKDTCKTFRSKADAVLKKVAEEMGLTFHGIGNIRFDGDELTTKIKVGRKGKSVPVFTVPNFGNKDYVGKSYKVKNTVYTVTRYNGKPKYCFDVVNQRGKRYCVAADFFNGAAIQHFYKNPFVK
jgi:hypothetical protein